MTQLNIASGLLRRFVARTVFIEAKPMTVIASVAKHRVYRGEANPENTV
jgi:hypothetical protein